LSGVTSGYPCDSATESVEQVLSDHAPLDLIRSLVDLSDFGVKVPKRHQVIKGLKQTLVVEDRGGA
jgi:hypothetical protein